MIIRFIRRLLEKSAELFQLAHISCIRVSEPYGPRESQNDGDTFPVQVGMLNGATSLLGVQYAVINCIVCV